LQSWRTAVTVLWFESETRWWHRRTLQSGGRACILIAVTTTDIARPTTEVHIRVAHDDDATRISAVLEALGYSVLRQLDEGDAPQRLRWAVTRLARRHKLTSREQDILELVLEGRTNTQIGRMLDISRATVKWHMHNVFAKTNTGTRESLLRLSLQLGGSEPVEQMPEISAPIAKPPVVQPSQPIAPAVVAAPAAIATPAPRLIASSVTSPVRPPASTPRSESNHWAAGPDDVTARIEFDQPRAPSASTVPSKSWM
jgi:DNA-binding CsgD family transcriptional regulator